MKNNLLSRIFRLLVILSTVVSLVGTQPGLAANNTAGGTPPPLPSAKGGDGLRFGYNNETGKLNFVGGDSMKPIRTLPVGLKTDAAIEATGQSVLAEYGPQFGLTDVSKELRVSVRNRTESGISTRFQQQFNGIPVMGGEMILNTDANGNVISLNGEVSPNLSLSSTQPTVSADQASQTALKGAQTWYKLSATGLTVSPPALWIYDERIFKPGNQPVALVWRMEVTTTDQSAPINELVLVNAITGEITLHFSQIDNASLSQVDTETPTPTETETPTATETPTETSTATETLTPAATETETETIAPTITETPTVTATPTITTTITKTNTPLPVGVLYVATTGNDDSGNNTCSNPILPCATIQQAVTKALPGNTIKVAIGTYTGSGFQVVNIGGQSIKLLGGWNPSFNVRSGLSIIDGEQVRRGVFTFGNPVTIDHFQIQNGFGTSDSGGIFNSGKLTLSNSIIKGGTTQDNYGGAIYNEYTTGILIISNTMVVDNNGHGIANYNGSVSLNNSTVSGNSGIGIRTSGNFTINNSTVSNNAMGIDNSSGTVTLNNSTIGNNLTEGISNTTFGYIIMNNSTISNNAIGIVGIKSRYTGSVNLQNSILAGNIQDCEQVITSSGHNLIGNTTGCSYTASTGDKINVNADLGPLRGSPGYFPLSQQSPAINAGNPTTCLSTDQRGITRPQGSKCDVGAYENIPSPSSPATEIGVISGSNQIARPGNTLEKPFIAYVVDNQGRPVSGATITFSAPASGASGTFANTHTRFTNVVTGNDGIATAALFTANNTVGSFIVTASTAGIAVKANFSIIPPPTMYVRVDGNDSADCQTPGSACQNIEKTIDKAVAGAQIRIAGGFYDTGSDNTIIIGKDVLLSGGWNSEFNTQNDVSIINRQEFDITRNISANFERLTIQNSSASNGGGIFNIGNLTLTSVTIRKNSAYQGGGILNGGNLTIINSTISENSGRYGGGIWNSTGHTTILKNTIIAGNSLIHILGETPSGPDCWGTMQSNNFNLIGSTAGCTITPLDKDQFNINPKLGSYLTARGYYPLLPNSPAIDAGDPIICPTTDIRGLTRPVDGNSDNSAVCDIGPYEYINSGAATNLYLNTPSTEQKISAYNLSLPFSVVVTDSMGSPVSGATVTFTAPASGAGGVFTNTGTNTTTAKTNANGIASSAQLKANIINGNYTVEASVTGIATIISYSMQNITSFVSLTGSDLNNNCADWTHPCKTLAQAMYTSSPEQTILVATGTYTNIGGPIVSFTKKVALSGGWNLTFTNQSESSTIDGQMSHNCVNMNGSGGMVGSGSMDHFIIQNCKSPYGGAAVNGRITLTNTIIRNNISGGDGGAINGGGIFENTIFEKNRSYGKGGAVAGGGTFKNTIFTGNSSNSNGGAIFSDQSDKSITLANSAILNNVSRNGHGGGIYISNASITIDNSLIYANYSAGIGGAIYTFSTLGNIRNSTVVYNQSGMGVGGVHNHRSGGATRPTLVSVQNSIFYNDGLNAESVTSYGYNIVKTLGETDMWNGKPSDKINVDPKLGELIIIPEKWLAYLIPAADSPAIDAGNPAIPGSSTESCLNTDQRDISRPAGSSCDIGSYERTTPRTATNIYVSDGNSQHGILNLLFGKPLKVVVLDNQNSPISGVAVTFSAPNSGGSVNFSNSNTHSQIVITDKDGIATTSITANNQTGSYNVSASITNNPNPVSFNLKNQNPNWYVSRNGSDTSNCATALTPCATINGVLHKTGFISDSTIAVASGTYPSTLSSGIAEIEITKNVHLIGGWSANFQTRTGASTIDERYMRRAIWIQSDKVVEIDGFNIINGKSDKGAGIFNQGELHLRNSTLAYNSSTGDGGGIFSTGKLTIENVTISGNAATNGAGIHTTGSYASMNNVTIVQNLATNTKPGDKTAGGIYATGPLTIKNSLIAQNSNINGDCYGTFKSQGYNIISVNNWCKVARQVGDQFGTNANPIDAKVGPLTSYNGRLVRPLLTASPALNAGNPAIPGNSSTGCLSVDERGASRPDGSRCDIGAFEGIASGSLAADVTTYTAQNSTSWPGKFLCSGNNATCTGGQNPQADSAHRYAFGAYNFYQDRDQGPAFPIFVVTHYLQGYNNAFWYEGGLFLGDKYNFANADDVIAHELTHGMTEHESNLFYYYQSGAINESLSDVWGEAYDQLNGKGNDSASVKWLMGEDVTGLGAIRNMKNPLQFQHPDKISSAYYYKGSADNGGVHTNSGINNKAVSLMVDGGSFNGKTVTALGWDKVLAIYYYAQTNLITSGADYADLYNDLYQACTTLAGTKGITAANCQQVRNATNAVQMNLSPSASYNPDAPFCAAGTSKNATDIFYDGFENDTNKWVFQEVTRWSLIPGNLDLHYAANGKYALFGNNNDLGRATNEQVSNSYAQMKTGVTIPANTPVFLHFNHAFGLEYNGNKYYDGGVLEYSLNNSATWIDASPLYSAGATYTGTIYNIPFSPGNYGYNNPLHGRAAFVAESHGYVSSRYNLTSLAGKNVRFRFRLGTDYTGYNFGWAVDDVTIYTCVGQAATPTLVAPANLSLITDYKPLLDWNNPVNATHYQLQVAIDVGFTHLLLNNPNITVSQFRLPTNLAENTPYFWRVRAINAANQAGTWSAVWRFRTAIAKPTLLAPISGRNSGGLKPIFDWDNVTGATGYVIQVSKVNTFTSFVLNQTINTAASSYTPTSNLPSGVLYWRVMATGPNGPSLWSNTANFMASAAPFTSTPTRTPTQTLTPTQTVTPTPTTTQSNTATPTITETPAVTETPTATPTETETPTPTPTL